MYCVVCGGTGERVHSAQSSPPHPPLVMWSPSLVLSLSLCPSDNAQRQEAQTFLKQAETQSLVSECGGGV